MTRSDEATPRKPRSTRADPRTHVLFAIVRYANSVAALKTCGRQNMKPVAQSETREGLDGIMKPVLTANSEGIIYVRTRARVVSTLIVSRYKKNVTLRL